MSPSPVRTPLVLCLLALALAALPAAASSHREAPLITTMPKVDGTDFYLFRSYEPGREAYTTLVANYLPLQDPYGGPNYFDLDPEAHYEIKIDNDGDGVEEITFRFRFRDVVKGLTLAVGPDGTPVAVPLKNVGQILPGSDAGGDPSLNAYQEYRVQVLRDSGRAEFLTEAGTGKRDFVKPVDNVGTKSLPEYAAYADGFVYDVDIPGCGLGRVFAGQRAEGFQVNLGEVFDLVNVGDPVGDPDGELSATRYKNVTSLALEVPTDCLTGDAGPILGAWTTASLPRGEGGMKQVSRLGMPLVNEVVIGLPDKDRFNSSRPADDGQFATYVTHPTLPELLELLFGVEAPNNFPRNDLLAAFVTGVEGLNAFGFGEMQRLNTSVAPTPAGEQSNLGFAGGDLAGFPNGRRPGDDVVDIELRVAMGLLCHVGLGLCSPEDAPSGLLPFTDGALVEAAQFDATFPYLVDPIPGSPNSANGIGEKP